MYPTLFRIGDFEITSFGVLVAIGVLVALQVFSRELKRSGLPASGADAALTGVLGGLMGAKLLWSIEHLGEEPWLSLVLSRGGMSWFGGLLGGVGTAIIAMRVTGVPVLATVAAATPALAIGHAIGRVGCFMVGDDYGRPTSLPWGVAFPEGLPPTVDPVHPTQLYEAAALVVIAWLLMRWRRGQAPDAAVLGRYLVLVGAVRFAIEFIRVNERIAGPLTLAHLVSLGLVLAGCVMLLKPAATATASVPSTSRRRRS
ncbi:MAG: prolipoprotein diacylglyceryl transferase [Vicinamibacterales bacterium]